MPELHFHDHDARAVRRYCDGDAAAEAEAGRWRRSLRHDLRPGDLDELGRIGRHPAPCSLLAPLVSRVRLDPDGVPGVLAVAARLRAPRPVGRNEDLAAART